MVIRPTDLPIGPPPEIESVHRVERDAEVQEFGHKQQQQRQSDKRSANPQGQSVHDTVDVSAEYLTAEHDGGTPLQANTSPPSEPAIESADAEEIHLDLEA